MKNLYLLGGGRWARVVLGEVIKLSDENLSIAVISNKNYLFMQEWVRKTFLDRNILVYKKIPENFNKDSFLYVLNETELRFETLLKLSQFKIPVLVEKPIGLNYYEADKIVNLYKDNKVPLMSAQVFRFLESAPIIRDILKTFDFHSILVYWSDPHSEVKSGEIKRYEKMIPPFLDILPHIFSLLEEIIGDFRVSFKSIIFNEIEKEFMLILRINSSLDLEIKYSRIASVRARYLEFHAPSGFIKYDFSKNETITKFEGNRRVLYKDYGKSKAIQLMLIKFLAYKEGGLVDTQFSHKTNISALKISQDIQNSIKLESDYKP